MIISKKYALKLIKEGKAEITTTVTEGDIVYCSINRYDLQRTDHFEE